MKRVLIGGLGRSGTTILLHALYCHEDVYAVPIETKFLVEEDGFADLVTSLTSGFSIACSDAAIGRFDDMMRLQVTGEVDSKFRMLQRLSNEIFLDYEAAVDDFIALISCRKYFPDRAPLIAATRAFIGQLFDAEAIRSDKAIWVEKTPSNIWRLPFLRELWPDCYFVHAMRDPRDVFMSLMERGWLPADVFRALLIFGSYLEALLAVRRAHASDPRFIEIGLRDLVTDTEATMDALASRLEIAPFSPAAKAELASSMERYYAEKQPPSFTLGPREAVMLNQLVLPAAIELGYPAQWQPS